MNIYQKINEVRKKIDYIQKDKQVQNYKAVTHDQVTALVRKHLIEIGVVIIPNLIGTTTIDSGDKTSKGTTIIRVEAEYEFSFVNTEEPNDKFTARVSAHANDQGDKGPGKALSYAKKAIVLKVFEIETGEDEESRYKEEEIPDITDHISAIESCSDMDELRAAYGAAVAACKGNRDLNSRVVKAKDLRKKALNG